MAAGDHDGEAAAPCRLEREGRRRQRAAIDRGQAGRGRRGGDRGGDSRAAGAQVAPDHDLAAHARLGADGGEERGGIGEAGPPGQVRHQAAQPGGAEFQTVHRAMLFETGRTHIDRALVAPGWGPPGDSVRIEKTQCREGTIGSRGALDQTRSILIRTVPDAAATGPCRRAHRRCMARTSTHVSGAHYLGAWPLSPSRRRAYLLPRNTGESAHERPSRLRAAEGLDLGQGERRPLRQHQPTDRGTDAREAAARRQAPASALLARHAERPESHDPAGGVAGARPCRRRVRCLAHPHRRRRPVRLRLRRGQPELEDPRLVDRSGATPVRVFESGPS